MAFASALAFALAFTLAITMLGLFKTGVVICFVGIFPETIPLCTIVGVLFY